MAGKNRLFRGIGTRNCRFFSRPEQAERPFCAQICCPYGAEIPPKIGYSASRSRQYGTGVYDEAAETFPILLDKPLTIRGEAGAVLDSPRFQTLVRVEADNVTITGVDFQVRKWGIVAACAQGMTLEDCTFTLADAECRTSSTALWMEGMKRCTLRSCAFNGVSVCVAGDPLSEASAGKAVLTGLCEVGEDLEYFTTHTIEGCTVNGKPLVYLVNQPNALVPEDAGGLIAVGCDGLTVRGLDVSDSSMGIEVVD